MVSHLSIVPSAPQVERVGIRTVQEDDYLGKHMRALTAHYKRVHRRPDGPDERDLTDFEWGAESSRSGIEQSACDVQLQ